MVVGDCKIDTWLSRENTDTEENEVTKRLLRNF